MAGAGLFTLIAFLAMPVVSVPFVGSITAPYLAGLVSYLGLGLGGLTAVVWVVPIAALTLITAGVAAWRSTAMNSIAAAAVALALATLGFGVYVWGGEILAALLSEIPGTGLFGVTPASVLSVGFWCTILGVLTGMTGAVIQLESSSRARSRALMSPFTGS